MTTYEGVEVYFSRLLHIQIIFIFKKIHYINTYINNFILTILDYFKLL
jgi:hypothetical protein